MQRKEYETETRPGCLFKPYIASVEKKKFLQNTCPELNQAFDALERRKLKRTRDY